MDKAKTKKKGRTINPDKVVTVGDWAKAYGKKYKNVVLSPDGEFWVVDPSLEDFEEPVKTIPHLHGYDYLNVLNSTTVSTELRAAAESKIESINAEIAGRVSALRVEFTNAEADLLIAIDNWKSTADPATRKVNAEAVSAANKKLTDIGTRMREAAYPARYVRSYNGLYGWSATTTTVEDRVIKVGGEAASY